MTLENLDVEALEYSFPGPQSLVILLKNPPSLAPDPISLVQNLGLPSAGYNYFFDENSRWGSTPGTDIVPSGLAMLVGSGRLVGRLAEAVASGTYSFGIVAVNDSSGIRRNLEIRLEVKQS